MSKHNFTIRLDDETHAWLQQQAQAQNRSVANFIICVLRLYKQNQNGSPVSESK